MSGVFLAGRVRVMVSHSAKGGFNNRSLSIADQVETQASDSLKVDVVNGDLLSRGKSGAHSLRKPKNEFISEENNDNELQPISQ